MQAKQKLCNGCNLKQFIWGNLAGKKYCQKCYTERKYTVKKDKRIVTAISKFSLKKIEKLKIYKARRDNYFKNHPVCEYPGCVSREVDLHHKKGRSGDLLIDDRFFCSLCRKHHIWVELHPEEAQELNLSLKRLENGNV